MKAKELMIGDLVCYNKPNQYFTKVQEIRCTSDGEEYYIRCKRDNKDTYSKPQEYEDFNVKILHPIPLTLEILEKNGFKYHEGEIGMYGVQMSSYYSCSDIYLGYDDGNSFSVWFGEEVNVKFVHQLQHILRLCNIDKQIIL